MVSRVPTKMVGSRVVVNMEPQEDDTILVTYNDDSEFSFKNADSLAQEFEAFRDSTNTSLQNLNETVGNSVTRFELAGQLLKGIRHNRTHTEVTLPAGGGGGGGGGQAHQVESTKLKFIEPVVIYESNVFYDIAWRQIALPSYVPRNAAVILEVAMRENVSTPSPGQEFVLVFSPNAVGSPAYGGGQVPVSVQSDFRFYQVTVPSGDNAIYYKFNMRGLGNGFFIRLIGYHETTTITLYDGAQGPAGPVGPTGPAGEGGGGGGGSTLVYQQSFVASTLGPGTWTTPYNSNPDVYTVPYYTPVGCSYTVGQRVTHPTALNETTYWKKVSGTASVSDGEWVVLSVQPVAGFTVRKNYFHGTIGGTDAFGAQPFYNVTFEKVGG